MAATETPGAALLNHLLFVTIQEPSSSHDVMVVWYNIVYGIVVRWCVVSVLDRLVSLKMSWAVVTCT